MQIFRSLGFDRFGNHVLLLNNGNAVESSTVQIGDKVSYEFRVDKTFCVGWRDITHNISYVCPESSIGQAECRRCQISTGFNPAFYNSNSVSAAQVQRNLEPHYLYLADYGSDKVKVGISHHARFLARLLEQGARSAIIAERFPTANVARQYEKLISNLPDFCESFRSDTKLKLLRQPYDFDGSKSRLNYAIHLIDRILSLDIDKTEIIDLSSYYGDLSAVSADTQLLLPGNDTQLIIGTIIAIVGTFIVLSHKDKLYITNMKYYVGKKFDIVKYDDAIDLKLSVEQATLF